MKQAAQAGPSKVRVVRQMDTREEEDGPRGLQIQAMDTWHHTPPSKQPAAGAGWRAGASGGAGAGGREAGRDAVRRAGGSRASTVRLGLNGGLRDLLAKSTLLPAPERRSSSHCSNGTRGLDDLQATSPRRHIQISQLRFRDLTVTNIPVSSHS